ncbi:MAG: hypothetical protein JWO42_423 [Chloroflexi bacterium]|nr:hypothetical protein [Chloroflexota bacterium]
MRFEGLHGALRTSRNTVEAILLGMLQFGPNRDSYPMGSEFESRVAHLRKYPSEIGRVFPAHLTPIVQGALC